MITNKKNTGLLLGALLAIAVLATGCNRKIEFPATLMEMNKPEYLLQDSMYWNKYESQHFLLHSSKKVDNDLIKPIIENQEINIKHIAKIMDIANINSLPKIRIWIFNSDKEKYLKTQVHSNAHALTEYWSVYYNKTNATGAHEIGHLMSQHFWGFPKSKKYDFLLQEGFAFYIDENRYFKFDFYQKAKGILRNEKYRISAIVKESNNTYYEKKALVCGAFIKYLITSYGVENFVRLWKSVEENESAFNVIYSESLADLEKDFYTFLEKET
ncbi:MAG: hypothetical protein U0W24_12355 [Bacteroidales bacterium]